MNYLDLLAPLNWTDVKINTAPLVLPADWDPNAHMEGTGQWTNIARPPFGLTFWSVVEFVGFNCPLAPVGYC